MKVKNAKVCHCKIWALWIGKYYFGVFKGGHSKYTTEIINAIASLINIQFLAATNIKETDDNTNAITILVNNSWI